MNVSKMREFFNEVFEVLLYPIFEKNEIAATHRRNLAKKKKKKKQKMPSTALPFHWGVIPAERYRAMLAKTNGTTPAQPTTRQPETINKRPKIHVGISRTGKAALAGKNEYSSTKPTVRRTEKFDH